VRIGVDAIDNYLDIMNTKYTKNIIIVVLIAHSVTQLDSWYWYKLLCILVDSVNINIA